MAVAYATAASSSADSGDAVGIALSQCVPAASQQLQQQACITAADVRLEFVRIPLLTRGHPLYRWTRFICMLLSTHTHTHTMD